MQEVWKDIKGYEGLYQVSNLGRVKSLTRKGVPFERYLKPYINKRNGYVYCYLTIKEKEKNLRLHRLVAEAFIPNPENKPEVNHEDGNKENCCVSNLYWTTRSENQKHAYKTGLQKHKRGNNSKLAKKVIQHDKDGNLIKEWESIIDVERTLGIYGSNISKCCKGKHKTAGGYIWRYKE